METINILGKKNNSLVELVKIDGKEMIFKSYQKFSHSMLVEINILANCRHPNIIQMLKLLEHNKSIGILMPKEDLCYMDLLENTNLTIQTRLNYLLQISYGLQYLHHKNIIHFDLKSDNIMVTNNICKIIDFGSSEYLFGNKFFTNQIKCTATHRPPEAFIGKIFVFDYTFDIWSLGIIIYETFNNLPMYKNIEYDEQFYHFIISEEFEKRKQKILPFRLLPSLSLEPNKRPHIDTILAILEKMQINF